MQTKCKQYAVSFSFELFKLKKMKSKICYSIMRKIFLIFLSFKSISTSIIKEPNQYAV